MNNSPVPSKCPYCSAFTGMAIDPEFTWVQCQNAACGSRGPRYPKAEENKAVLAWNNSLIFGRTGIANVPAGMPADTGHVAEKLRLLSDAVLSGEYGFPTGYVLALTQAPFVKLCLHNLQKGEVHHILSGILSDITTRAAVRVKG